jgi:hypothetical protein
MVTVPPQVNKNEGTPNPVYQEFLPIWTRSRAAMTGEHAVKAHDHRVSTKNLLIPFSPQMRPEQYDFYKAEAEFPGLTSQYGRVVLGGLLRKRPSLDTDNEDVQTWLEEDFTEDGGSLVSFLDEAIWEELVTTRAGVQVDFPVAENYEALDPEERARVKPYPILWKAEQIINWRERGGKLVRVVLRYVEEVDSDEHPMHVDYLEKVKDLYINEEDHYQCDIYQEVDGASTTEERNATVWEKVAEYVPEMGGEPLDYIPFWFLNGSVDPLMPVMSGITNREIALYNKVSRRNHLLYSASTFTPVLFSNINDEEFDDIVDRGLGTWIRLSPEDSIDSLKTPTEALGDLNTSIEQTVAEISKMGVRMLAPEGGSDTSGIALEIRNSAQTAQLSILNTKISKTMESVFRTMIDWYYGGDAESIEVTFTMSTDFNPSPIGAEWMRLITEWYQDRLIPRSTFINVAKHNDVLPGDYNDSEAQTEIQEDPALGASVGSSIVSGREEDEV